MPETKRPVGRPPADKVRVSYTIDDDLPALMEKQAQKDGFIHNTSKKPNVSAWLNALVRRELDTP